MYKKHYTPIYLAEQLLGLINRRTIKTAVDVASGSGNLLHAAIKIFNVESNGFDLHYSEKDLKSFNNQEYIVCLEKDALKVNDPIHEYGDYDLILSNPPFDGRKYIDCDNQFLSCYTTRKKFLLEEYFVLLNLCLMKRKSSGVFILPASIINNVSGEWIREIMLSYLNITYVIEIPIGVFENVNVSTYALIFDGFEKVGTSFGKYVLGSIKINEYYQKMSADRFDMSASKKDDIVMMNLSDLIYSHSRGYTKYNKKDFYYIRMVKNTIPLIHTDNIKNGKIQKSMKQYYLKTNGELYREQHEISENDILISRVGSGCIGKPAIVTKYDSGVISDCVFLLKLKNKKLSKNLFVYLLKLYNEGFYKTLGRGSNKSVLVINDLLSLKIPMHILK